MLQEPELLQNLMNELLLILSRAFRSAAFRASHPFVARPCDVQPFAGIFAAQPFAVERFAPVRAAGNAFCGLSRLFF